MKEQVYEPDWRGEERTQYTINVANVLADVCPRGIAPSIQSAPLGFKPRVTGDDVINSYTDHVLRVVAHLIALEAKTGSTLQLALEPEPFCFLETTDETIAYFRDQLYSGAAVEKLAKLARVPISEANAALRRHLGIVYDICHQAVEFEDIPNLVQKLVNAGVPILKLQEAAALHIPEVTQRAVDTLKRYAKTIYLTQTLEKRDGKMTRYLNVDDAIAAFEKDPGPREWRTHIHVPVFLDDLGEFRTTRFTIAEALRFHKQNPVSRHLEVETYTWDMLPDSLKSNDIVDYICRDSTGCAASWSDGSRRKRHESRVYRAWPHGPGHDAPPYRGRARSRRLQSHARKIKPLIDAGASAEASIKAAATFGDAVFTMVSDDAAALDVVTRPAE